MLSNNHWTLPNFRQRMTKKQWRDILLNDQDKIIYKGLLCQLKAKDLGAGVVEVYKALERGEGIDG